jgi:hypothetical protein
MSDTYGCKKCGTNWTGGTPMNACPDCDKQDTEYTTMLADIKTAAVMGWDMPDGTHPMDALSVWLAAHDKEVRAGERGEAHDRVIQYCMDNRHNVYGNGSRQAIQPCPTCLPIAAAVRGDGSHE